MSRLERSYRFHPLDRRGVMLGLGVAQVVTVVAGALAGLLALQLGEGPGPALVVVAVALVAAGAPVGGRALVDWVPVGSRWLVRARGATRAVPGASAPPPGVVLAAGRVEAGEAEFGVIRDRREGTWAAVVRVAGPPFALLDADAKRRLLAAWGAVLASTTRPASPIHRLQWIQRACPTDIDALRAHFASHRSTEAPRAAVTAYEELLAAAAAGTGGYEVLVVLAVHPRRAGRQLRSFGSGPDAVHSLLRREVRLLAGQLRRVGIEASDPLDVRALAGAVRAGCEPGARHGIRVSGDRSAWPVAWREGWAQARVDGGWHATNWVAEWPRRDVGPDFLVPLLLSGGARAISVTMAPVPARVASRQAESARTAELADEQLRQRAGFLATARNRRRAEGVATREAELADGHGELRFSGYVTVSGATAAELDANAAAVDAAAQQSGLELRRLYGRQQEAFTWTLPLGRGLA